MADPIFYTRKTAEEWEAKLIQAIKQLDEQGDAEEQAEREHVTQAFEIEKRIVPEIKETIQTLELRLKEIEQQLEVLTEMESKRKEIDEFEYKLTELETEKKSNERVELAAELKEQIRQQKEIVAKSRLEMIKNIDAKKALLLAEPAADDNVVVQDPPENAELLDQIHHAERALEGFQGRLNRIPKNEQALAENTTPEKRKDHLGRILYNIQYNEDMKQKAQMRLAELHKIDVTDNKIKAQAENNERPEMTLEEILAIQEEKADIELQLKLEKDKLVQAEEEFKDREEEWNSLNKKWEENKQARENAQREREQLEAEKDLVMLRNKPEEILAVMTDCIKTEILSFELEHPANLHKEIRKALLQIRSSLVKMQLTDAGLKDDVEIENNEAVLFAGKNKARQHFYATMGMLYEVCESLANYYDTKDDKAQRKLIVQFNARVEALIDACFYDERDDSLKQYHALDVIAVDDDLLIRIENQTYLDIFDALEVMEESIPAEKSPVLRQLQNLSETLRLEIDSAPDLDRKHRIILLEQTVEMIKKAKANKLSEADIVQYQALAQQSQQDRPSVGWKIAGLILAIAGLLVAAAGIFAKYKSLMLLSPIADPLIGGGTAGILVGLAMYQYGNQSCVASAMNNVVTGLKQAQLAQPPVEPVQEKENEKEELLPAQEDDNDNHFEAPKKNEEGVVQDDKRMLLV